MKKYKTDTVDKRSSAGLPRYPQYIQSHPFLGKGLPVNHLFDLPFWGYFTSNLEFCKLMQ